MSGFRWHLPEAPLRGRAVRAAGLGCLGVIGLGLLARSWLHTAPMQPLVAAAMFATMMTVAIGAMDPHHPFARFGPANHVTLVRAGLMTLAASLIPGPVGSDVAWVGVCVTAVMAALDGLDGWLARRSRMVSAFGARFDMETDALLILVLSLLVWRHQKAAIWVLGCGLMRYAFVAAGWLLPWLSRPLRSTRRAKAVTVGQFAALGAALAPVVPGSWSSLAAAAALTALVWSFAIDVRFLWRNRVDLARQGNLDRSSLELA